MQKTLRTVAAIAALAMAPVAAAGDADWIAKSNENANLVLADMAKFNPEAAGGLGVEGIDEKVIDLEAGIVERGLESTRRLIEKLEQRREQETDPRVRQDIDILLKVAADNIRTRELNRDYTLPYFNVSRTVFGGIRALIDPQVDRARYPAAIRRIEKYAGIADGYSPITELAKARTRERFDVEGLIGPFRGEVEQDLERSETFVSGIEQLLGSTDLEGWQQSYETLAAQLRDYNDWLRSELLPRARTDYRLPPALYENALRNWGVDASPHELIEAASKGYMDIRNEMQALAPIVASKMGYDTDKYQAVIAQLKEDGAIDGDKLVDHYHAVLSEIEDILVREKLVSLPERDAGIRIATAAETAAQPAPHLEPPRLIGNTGEYPNFVIPLLKQYEDGSWQQTDDTYEAGAWTLTAHEARPGHEMQFSSIIESGVSITRALFAFNSANVEGWGLYAEAIVKPYLPVEAQLISLQYRLMRAGRMFLDPMLNLGLITPEQAKRLIVNDMAIGEDWAQNEIERYTYRMPGQATSYYYGYNKMQALRLQTELKLQDRFDQKAFHDFVLSQGLLPPELLREAVMNEFVPSQL